MTPIEIVTARVDHAEASVRRTLLLIATLFALILLFQFTSLDQSWSVVRYALTQRAELFYACRPLVLKDQRPEACVELDQRRKLGADPIGEREMSAYVSQRHLLKEDAIAARQKEQEIYFDNVLRFNIPPLGVSVDAQDVGLVASVGFSILLVWLAVCLRRQTNALSAFHQLTRRLRPDEQYGPRDWELVSDLIAQSMYGVVPTGHAVARLTAWVLHALIVAPLVLVLWITIDAYQTHLYHDYVVPSQVRLTLSLDTIGGLVLGIVTVAVLFQVWRTPSFPSSEWSTAQQEKAGV